MQIAPTHNGYAPPNALTYNLITPPLSSKDGNRKTRTRTRRAVVVEGPRAVVDNSESRKTRKRQY